MEGPFGGAVRTRRPLINITPLVDVMLLLLIFFMVTSTFHELRVLDIQLPGAATSRAHPERTREITIAADGSISFDGTSVTHDGLQGALRDQAVAHPDMPVVLRADRRTPYAYVVRVLDMARTAGLDQLVLPVTPIE